jgi:Na+/H+ antiporter NhaD/arsenite permease-like protein
LALTPLVLHLASEKSLDPKPYLIGLAVASNVGSTATLTGNPQNMIIGGLSQISYLRFAAKLAPIAILGLVVAYIITAIVFRVPFSSAGEAESPAEEESIGPKPLSAPRRRLLTKSVLVTCLAIGLFAAGAPLAIVALGAAAILLLDRVEPKKIYRQVDWGLLVMFAGLFVVVEAFQVHVLAPSGIEHWRALAENPIVLLSLVSAFLSNLVSNVPAVLLFENVIPAMSPEVRETAWLALAMSSTLAGNLTVLGSVANLIVVENARSEGVLVSLVDYCRVGVPVTLATLAIGMAWLSWVHY